MDATCEREAEPEQGPERQRPVLAQRVRPEVARLQRLHQARARRGASLLQAPWLRAPWLRVALPRQGAPQQAVQLASAQMRPR